MSKFAGSVYHWNDSQIAEVLRTFHTGTGSYARAATRGRGAKEGSAPLNKIPPPLRCPSKLLFSLRQFQDGGFFFGNQQKTRKYG